MNRYDNLIKLFTLNSIIDIDDEIMKNAWDEEPELFVKIIFYIRDIKRGKGERDITFRMLYFLRKYKYMTYELNIRDIVKKYGRIKDLLDLALLNDDNSIELEILGEFLREDLNSIYPSLAVKWAPRENNKYKKLCYKLARILYPDDKNYLELYRKNILRELTKKVSIVENLMCKNEWDNIIYEHVPKKAMLKYGRDLCYKWEINSLINVEGAFIRNDKERFINYLKNVNKGDCNSYGAFSERNNNVYIYDLINKSYYLENKMINLEWKKIVNSVENMDTYKSSVAIIDTDMKGKTLDIAIALGLLISEVSSEPFTNKIITFEEEVKIFNIDGNTLHKKVKNIKKLKSSSLFNINNVLELILNKYSSLSDTTYNILTGENIIKTIFIFTNKSYEEIINTELNYNNIPTIIIWNLNEDKKFPINILSSSSENIDEDYKNNIIYISGFSIKLLNLFMKGINFNEYNVLSYYLENYNCNIPDEEYYEYFYD